MSEQNYTRADSLARRDKKFAVSQIVFPMLQAFKTGNQAEFERLRAEYLKLPKKFMGTAYDLAAMDPAAGEALAVEIQKFRKPGDQRDFGYLALAAIDMEQGQLNAALARLDSAGAIGTLEQARLATVPLVQIPREKLLDIYKRIAALDSVAPANDATEAGLKPHFRMYHMAMLSCRLGDTAQALQFAQRIESMPAAPHWKESMSALATNVRAQVDLQNGDAKLALARLESIKTDPPMDLLFTPAGRVVETLWRAELLYLNGRNDEALAWFENIDDVAIYEVPIYSYSMLRRAELLERKGQTREAMALYSQVLKNWSGAEPSFQPYVTQARNALTRLQKKVG